MGSWCLGGDHACTGDRAHGGGSYWYHGGVGGWPVESLRFHIHSGYGSAEDSGGGDFRNECM